MVSIALSYIFFRTLNGSILHQTGKLNSLIIRQSEMKAERDNNKNNKKKTCQRYKKIPGFEKNPAIDRISRRSR